MGREKHKREAVVRDDWVIRKLVMDHGAYSCRLRHKETGERCYFKAGTDNLARARVLFEKWFTTLLERRHADGKSFPLAQAAREYLVEKERSVRAVTFRDYKAQIEAVAAEFAKDGIVNVSDIRQKHVKAVLDRMSEQKREDDTVKKWSGRTAQKYHAALYGFFKWLMENEHIDRNPAAYRLPKPVRDEIKNRPTCGVALSEDQARQLLTACRESFAVQATCKKGVRDGQAWVQGESMPPEHLHLAVLLGLRTGLRLKNIIQLRVGHLRNKCTELQIQGSEMKGGRMFHVPVHPELQPHLHAALRRIAKSEGRTPLASDSILGGVTFLRRTFWRAVKRAGLVVVDGKRLRFHDLRHTFASWLAHKAPRVCEQALLGHSITDVTGRYEHTSLADLRVALDALPWLEPEAQSAIPASAQDAVNQPAQA